MGCYWNYVTWAAILLIPALVHVLFRKKSSSHKLPPGPPGWPIIGNLFDLGALPHKTLVGMKQKYGPIVWLNIGSVKTMAIVSAREAAELFKNHDACFADRKNVDIVMVHNFMSATMALAPYGTYWRMLRRICTVEMFTSKKVNETVNIREKCVDLMLQWIEKEANSVKKGSGIDVRRFVSLATFNMMGNFMLSRNLVDPDSKKASEFFTVLARQIELNGTPNISDLFPFLRWLDLQGLRKQSERDMGKLIEFVSTFVRERMERKKEGGEKKKDFLEVLLEFEGTGNDEPAKLSIHQINMFILEMFVAGSDTTSNSVEWALTELLRNPEAMTRVKAEIIEVVGPKKKFEESDIDNLHYMQAVVKETLRLHPPIPLLLPRRAIRDTNFMGYDIPAGTQVLVDAWAIGRDPEYWEDPLAFKPERFLSSKFDFKGQNFDYIPFGSGRRMCVGLPLANRMMHFHLGSLLHTFNWELPNNVTPKSMDMKERNGATVSKLQPLKAIPIKVNI